MLESKFSPALHRFAIFVAFCALALIAIGGLVTSHGVGMSVPDWPNSYGYNMFLFPPSRWVGGIFYEHTHRLLASGVGLLTAILAAWVWIKKTGKTLRWLGTGAFLAVILQGVLGGLRVVLDAHVFAGTRLGVVFGIFHGCLGQAFFVLLCVIVLLTSRWWMERFGVPPSGGSPGRVNAELQTSARPLSALLLFTTGLIFLQLILGATMRHQHAGLAISDFPRAHGQWWPDLSAEAIQRYNAARNEVVASEPITAMQVVLQMAHRLVAATILVLVATCCWRIRRAPATEKVLRQFSFAWLTLVLAQVGLGVWTIWSNKAADVATLHVVGGALSLTVGALICIIAFRGHFRCCGDAQNLASTALPDGPERPASGNQTQSDF